MDEPADLTAAILGDFAAADPWTLEVWIRDDKAAEDKFDRWFRPGGERADGLRWTALEYRARSLGVPVAVYPRPG